MARATRILCHDCCVILTADELDHYVYQCHACVVIEHDLVRLARTDPNHPDVVRLSASAIELPRPPSSAEIVRLPRRSAA